MRIPAELERPVYDLKFLEASDMLKVTDTTPVRFNFRNRREP
jgi:hypothetical protein